MASSLYPGVDSATFLQGHAEREERLYSTDDPVGNRWTALWAVVEFMNHNKQPTATIYVFGKIGYSY